MKVRGREHERLRILRQAAYWKQNGLCYWCAAPMLLDAPPDDPRVLTADHLTPRHAGGQTQQGNIVAACRDCNNKRHPELNQIKRSTLVYSVGDDTPRSPFEILGRSANTCIADRLRDDK